MRVLSPWDAEPPRDHETIRLDRPLAAFRFSADGKTLATLEKDGTFSLLETDSGTLLRRRELDPAAKARPSRFFAGAGDISRDLRTLLIADGEGGVSLWDAELGRQRALLGARDGPVYCLGITPDGIYGYVVRDRRRVEFWELNSPRLLSKVEGEYGHTEDFPDGSRLLIYDLAHNTPLLWEPLRGRIQEPARMLFRPRCLSVSSDGRILVFENILDGVAQNRDVQVWDTERWLPIATPIRSPVELVSLAFDPTSRTLAGSGEDGRVRLWDVASGEDLLTLEGHSGKWFGPIAFSPDGQTLATYSIRSDGRSEIFLCHTAEGEPEPSSPEQGASTNPAH